MDKVLDFYEVSDEDNALPAGESAIVGFSAPTKDRTEASINLTKELIRHPNTTFFARVEGNSMSEANIYDGDLLIVDRSLDFEDGDLAVCFVHDEFTIKYIERNEDGLFLLDNDPDAPKIVVDPEDNFVLWGVITYVIHKPSARRRID